MQKKALTKNVLIKVTCLVETYLQSMDDSEIKLQIEKSTTILTTSLCGTLRGENLNDSTKHC